jgi:uncharacterized protein (DUF4415 family)
MKSTKNIKYGAVEIAKNDLSPENVKIKVTTFVDQDVLRVLKERAAAEGVGYQTLLNRTLRQSILGEKSLPDRVKVLELDIKKIKQELQAVG